MTSNQSKEHKIYLESQLTEHYGKEEPNTTVKEKLKSFAKEKCTCSGSKCLNFFLTFFPFINICRRYKKRWLIGDISAGLTLGIVNVPQGMAYALLASVPPVHGLYTSFFPAIIYAFFATSRHISIGTFAVISLMVGDVVEKRVPPCPTIREIGSNTEINGTLDNFTSCEDEYNARKVEYAIALSVAVGALQLVMYLFNLGIITKYLSEYLISAFTCAGSFYVMTSQVPKLLAVNIPRQSGILGLIKTYVEVFKNIKTANPWDVLVSVCCIVFLVIGKEINARLKTKIAFPPPWELLIIIFATLASYFGKLESNHGVTVVGNIPTGIRIMIPQGPDILDVLVDAIPIAVVLYAIEISLVQMFAVKHSYETDSNQELIALGLANIGSSFFGCFPCASSLSRAAIWDEVGGKSQLTGLIQSIIILVILLWIGPLFESLPQAALASIIVVNLKRLLLQFEQLPGLWEMNKLDAISWMVTWLAVMLLGVDLGLGVAVGFEILAVIIKMQMSIGHVQGQTKQKDMYRSCKYYNLDDFEKGVTVFKYNGPIYFANKDSFKVSLFDALGYDPMKRSAKMKKALNDEEEVVEPTNGHVMNGGRPVNKENAVIIYNIEAHVKYDDEKKDRLSEKPVLKNKKWTYFILDMSSCSFIDSDAAKLLNLIHNSFQTLRVQLLMANCSRSVQRVITARLKESRPPFFVSLDRAIEHGCGISGLQLNKMGELDKIEKNEDDLSSIEDDSMTRL